MKHFLTFTLFIIAALTLVACGTSPSEGSLEPDPEVTPEVIDIYYLNDLHGAILPSGNAMGMARIGNFLIERRRENPEGTFVLAGGDMLQGSALSNYYHGKSVIELMNATYFDALAIGNHEFDWGLEVVTDYFDPDGGIAEFPLLGANVHYKGTDDMPENIDPYVIFERGDLRIGIIGTIGYGLESSIARRMVENYEFKNPGPIVEDYARYLRQDEDVDIVLLLTHDIGNVNDDVRHFDEDARVDAIFNGHRHWEYTRYDGDVPAIQSGAYGEYVGHIRFELDGNDIVDTSMRNLSRNDDTLFWEAHPDIQAIIDEYVLETDEIFNDPIITPARGFDRGELSDWAAELMRIASSADVGSQNYGGTRHPFPGDEPITLSTLYEVWPFDNAVVAADLLGSDLNHFIDTSNNISYGETTAFDDDEYYTIATNDYVFYYEDNRFDDIGENITELPLYIRELIELELKLQAEVYGEFCVTNDILITPYAGQEDWPIDEIEGKD